MSVSMKERQYVKILIRPRNLGFNPCAKLWEKKILSRDLVKNWHMDVIVGRAPISNIRFGKFPLTDPYLVVVPGTYEEVIAFGEICKFVQNPDCAICAWIGRGGRCLACSQWHYH